MKGASNVWNVNNNGNGSNFGPTNTNGARPSYYLSSDVKILEGSGLENDPYIVYWD